MSAAAIPHVELPGFALPGEEIFDRILDALRHGEGALADARRKLINFMSPGFSDAQELTILDSVFGDSGTNLNTAPTYLALTETTAVVEGDTGSTIDEADYTGYARKSIAAAEMGAAAAGAKSNSAQLTFAACTAGSDTIIGWAVCTAATVGAIVVFGTCTSTVISTTQTPATVAVGALSVTLD